MRARLGLDIPLWQQYLRFLWNALTFDFGKSFVNSQSVAAMVGLNLPYTIELTIVSTLSGRSPPFRSESWRRPIAGRRPTT